jgi:hypothetical protein
MTITTTVPGSSTTVPSRVAHPGHGHDNHQTTASGVNTDRLPYNAANNDVDNNDARLNYLKFAANKPRAPLLVPAVVSVDGYVHMRTSMLIERCTLQLRPEGYTLLKARSSQSPSPSPTSNQDPTVNNTFTRTNNKKPSSRSATSTTRLPPTAPTVDTLPLHASPTSPSATPTSKWLQGQSPQITTPAAIIQDSGNNNSTSKETPSYFKAQYFATNTDMSSSNASLRRSYRSGTSSPTTTTMSTTTSKLSKPVGQMLSKSQWTPDSEVSRCQYSDCSATFPPTNRLSETSSSAAIQLFSGFTNIISHPFQSRRHHCRSCGKIFCSMHSSNTLLLSYDQDNATASNGLHPPPPTTPGLASPVGGAFPFSSILRRSSASGSATPSSASFPEATQETSSSPTNSFSANHLIPIQAHARVCDDCFISLQVSANLQGLNFHNSATSPPSLSSSATSHGRTASEGHSPQSYTNSQQSHIHMASRASSTRGDAVSDVRSTHVHPSTRNRQYASRDHTQTTTTKNKNMHPLDPRHAQIQKLAGEDSSGSNPDGSLAASLGTTPAIGWTWST